MGISATELKNWVDRINEELAGLLQRYESEQYICEICLKRSETLIAHIRYELEQQKRESSGAE